MIQIFDVISYLRDSFTTIQVDGAAEYQVADDKSRLPKPALYVMLGPFTAGVVTDPKAPDRMIQEYDQRISILAHIDNTLDRTGKSAQQYVYVLKNMLLKYLYGHYFGEIDEVYPLSYVEDRMVASDPANYWHEFIFRQVGLMSPYDFQDPIILDNFDKFYADWNLPETDEDDHPDAQDHLEKLYDGN